MRMKDENFSTEMSAPMSSLKTAVMRYSILSRFEVEKMRKAKVIVNIKAVFRFQELWFLKFFETILSDFKDFQ